MTGYLFAVTDPLGREVRLTENCYTFHILLEHPELSDVDRIAEAIESPVFIAQDAVASQRLVYYRAYQVQPQRWLKGKRSNFSVLPEQAGGRVKRRSSVDGRFFMKEEAMRVTAHGRVHRSEAEWRTIFDQYQQSGLEPAVFCEREGIVWSSFQKWRRRLHRPQSRGTGVSPASGQFVELLPSRADGARGEVEVQLPTGIVIRVRG